MDRSKLGNLTTVVVASALGASVLWLVLLFAVFEVDQGALVAAGSMGAATLVGAGAGALIGEHNDRELEGAAVGGVVGAIAGGLLGSARDEEYYGRAPAPAPRYRTYQQAPPYSSYGARYNSYRGYSGHYTRSYGYGHHHHYPRYRSGYRSSSYCR